jgi:FtsH-binding integral membrane protein
MLLTVFIGFARSYFLAGVFHAPLPSAIIHVHGAAFTCWILLLVTQTSLVSAGRVDIHRRLGIAGFLLGCCMVVLGVWAATDQLVRRAADLTRDPKAFYIVPMTEMLMFATLILFAFRARRDPTTHKRLIYIATSAITIAAIARMPIPFMHGPLVAGLLYDLFLLALVIYDLWSTHKIHRATIFAGAFVVFVQLIRFPIAQTATWHAFATWAQNLYR